MVATENFSAPTRHPRADFSSCNAFDKYAFHIWVKFGDDEELQLLTANCASSGKRAVCTIPYIIALQVHQGSDTNGREAWCSTACAST